MKWYYIPESDTGFYSIRTVVDDFGMEVVFKFASAQSNSAIRFIQQDH